MPAPPAVEYDALTQRAGVAPLERAQIEVTGKDRTPLLHGLCTNDIKRLQPGEGCEAFLTNPQGHTIGYIDVFCRAEALIVDSVASEAPAIIRHLDRYVVREQVHFEDQTQNWGELLIAGPAAFELLQQIVPCPLGDKWGANCETSFRGTPIAVRRTTYCGPDCFQVSGERSAIIELERVLAEAGGQPCSAETLEAARIEHGTPLFGRDITADNLPQEVDRDERAISFDKGCYIGQETVARIDSLGHVNRILRQLRFSGTELPPPGSQIERDGKAVAQVTSSCCSPKFQAPLALGYVRRGLQDPGTRFESPWGTVEVLAKPS